MALCNVLARLGGIIAPIVILLVSSINLNCTSSNSVTAIATFIVHSLLHDSKVSYWILEMFDFLL